MSQCNFIGALPRSAGAARGRNVRARRRARAGGHGRRSSRRRSADEHDDFAPRAFDAQREATPPRAALERGDALSAVARTVAEKLR
ncbi:hypothetical protein F7R21_11410 [Burkholderia latens]|uniref:Uncharacterized protein n=1 Tax=Burkholderia latens TaxID=488446 RepID=A0A6H9TCT1_9BURK|nr:hypothetical protein F7R21_11410 [Burkholderia latens]